MSRPVGIAMLLLVLASACATARARSKPVSDCNYVGEADYVAPRAPVLSTSDTMGPSKVIWVHPPAEDYLISRGTHVYSCTPHT